MIHRLDRSRWAVLSPYLDEALDLPDAERAQWLDALRARDATLAAELDTLLGAYRQIEAEDFLGQEPLPRATLCGQTVGAYTLREPIGRGGMGTVWRAERSDGRYEGLVAVKLLNVSLIGHEAEERFRREGSILARLRHPHIAHLVDAGVSAAGQPYLVLEHVAGEHIDVYCDRRRLGVEARVRLFLDVLGAVSHAHANLIVHRDLKPSNVLVDGAGTVKLLDFGVAKLLAADAATAPTAVTREGTSALTPEYAAPEQLAGADITTATDVFALGVLLYGLLSGRHPAGAWARSAPGELVRAILEREPARLSAAALVEEEGDSARDRAGSRGSTPQALSRALRGDLDTIAAKALKKDAGERYQTADALADDLRRYLGHQPISARPDSLAYRSAKFVRRHRLPMALAVVAAMAIAAGIAGTLSQAGRARAEASLAREQRTRADEQARSANELREFALRELGRAEAVKDLDFYLLTDAAPGDKPVTVDQILTRTQDVLRREYGRDDDARVEQLVQVAEIYLTRSDRNRALPLMKEAYTLARASSEPLSRARAACSMAEIARMSGDNVGAEALVKEGLDALPAAPQYDIRRATCLLAGAFVAEDDGRLDEAVARIEEAQRLVRSSRLPSLVLELDVSAGLAEAYRVKGRLKAAAAQFAAVWKRFQATGRDGSDRASSLLNNWGLVLNQLGRPLEAEPVFRRSIAIQSADPLTGGVSPIVLANLADDLSDLGRYREALSLAEKGYADAVRLGEVRHRKRSLSLLARLYLNLDQPGRAARAMAELQPLVEQPGSSPLSRAVLDVQQARLALVRGERRSAAALAERAVQKAEEGNIAGDMLAWIVLVRAQVRLGLDDAPAAQADAERALALTGPGGGGPADASCWRGEAYLRLAQAQAAQGRTAEARAAATQAVRELAPTLGDDNEKTRAARAFTH